MLGMSSFSSRLIESKLQCLTFNSDFLIDRFEGGVHIGVLR